MAPAFTSRDFLLERLTSVRSSVTLRSRVDRENLDGLERELRALARRHKTLSHLRVLIFVLLYASILSNLALPALVPIVQTVTLVANLLGAGILSLAAIYVTWRLGQLWDRMVVIGSHAIAICEKHNTARYPFP